MYTINVYGNNVTKIVPAFLGNPVHFPQEPQNTSRKKTWDVGAAYRMSHADSDTFFVHFYNFEYSLYNIIFRFFYFIYFFNRHLITLSAGGSEPATNTAPV
jgi:hypothetical protein